MVRVTGVRRSERRRRTAAPPRWRERHIRVRLIAATVGPASRGTVHILDHNLSVSQGIQGDPAAPEQGHAEQRSAVRLQH